MASQKDAKHHVVVIGGGFAGLQCVRKLKHKDIRITLIDQRNHHLFQPLLYQVATTILPTSEIAWPIRRVMRQRKDVTTLMATVRGIDRQKRMIECEDGTFVGYDTLVIATGARHSYFGRDEWENAAPGLKTLEDATTIRRRMLRAFEYAERESDPDRRAALLTFAVIGAGPTGVELAGIIAELAQRALPEEFRNIDTHEAQVLLIEAGPRVLPVFPEKLSDYAMQSLEKMGVKVVTGTPVTDCTPTSVTIGEQGIGCCTTIWAAGVAASPAAQWLDVEADRAGRAVVQDNLTIPDHPEIFVIGDTACVKQADGSVVPGLAPAAKQQGQFVAKTISCRMKNKPAPQAFQYAHQGNLATIGKRAAVADFGFISLKGGFAWWVWGIAHIYFLIGTRSRVAVAWSWLWSYMTGQNSARLITQKDDRDLSIENFKASFAKTCGK